MSPRSRARSRCRALKSPRRARARSVGGREPARVRAAGAGRPRAARRARRRRCRAPGELGDDSRQLCHRQGVLTRASSIRSAGTPNATFAEMVSLMRKTSWGTTPSSLYQPALSSEIGRPPHSIDPLRGLQEPEHEVQKGALAGAAGTHECHGVVLRDHDRDTLEDGSVGVGIRELEVVDDDVAREPLARAGLLLVPAPGLEFSCGAQHDAQPDPAGPDRRQIGGDPVQRRQRAQDAAARTGPARSAHRRVSRWRTSTARCPRWRG